MIASSSGSAYGTDWYSVTFRAIAFASGMSDSDESSETFYYDAESQGGPQQAAAAASGQPDYDANGNLIAYKDSTYTYDAQNRLTAADNGATNVHVHYYYDGFNRRIATSDTNGNVTINVWDGWNLIEERTTGNGLIYSYIDGAGMDEKVRRIGGPTTLWYYQDGRGNTSHLANDSGGLIERYTYDLAGRTFFFDSTSQPINSSTFNNRFLFQGREYSSELGLYDYRNRIYFPGWGRFLQSDPIGFAGDPTNMYRHCGNDPVNSSDPSGMVEVKKQNEGMGGGDNTLLGDGIGAGTWGTIGNGDNTPAYFSGSGTLFVGDQFVGSNGTGAFGDAFDPGFDRFGGHGDFGPNDHGSGRSGAGTGDGNGPGGAAVSGTGSENHAPGAFDSHGSGNSGTSGDRSGRGFSGHITVPWWPESLTLPYAGPLTPEQIAWNQKGKWPTLIYISLVAAPEILDAIGAEVLRDNTHFDGPTARDPNRIGQIRFGNMPIVRLDYGRMPGSQGRPRLHLNFFKTNIHVPLDFGWY